MFSRNAERAWIACGGDVDDVPHPESEAVVAVATSHATVANCGLLRKPQPPLGNFR
jgi:hypothetical protein